MAERLIEHPILMYLIFVLPALLMIVALAVKASVFVIILIPTWLGVAFVLLLLPIESDDSSSS
jgi:hypothetical protein